MAMFELPTKIDIAGKEYHLRNNGDFRVVLDCFSALNDTELDDKEKAIACSVIFYDFENLDDMLDSIGDNLEEAVDKMFEFFNCNQKTIGASKSYKLVDWEQDEQLIASAINNVAGIEIRLQEYMHWWTFMGYYTSVGQSTFATVVSIRDKIKSGKKLDKWEKDFRKDNPEYFIWDSKTDEEKRLEDVILSQWNKE